jgi:hypothetical protein
LNDVTEVQELLDALVKVSTRDHKYYSSVDLRNYAQEQLGFSNALNRFDNALMSTGTPMPKSMSLDQLSTVDPSERKVQSERLSSTVSSNLGEYLGAIQDGDVDEDEPFFF